MTPAARIFIPRTPRCEVIGEDNLSLCYYNHILDIGSAVAFQCFEESLLFVGIEQAYRSFSRVACF